MPGSIEDRGTNCWRLIASAGTNGLGKRVKITRTFHGSKREAERALAKLVAAVDEGKIVESPHMTLSRWAEIWFREHVDKTLAGKTRTLYHYIFRTRILPGLGRIQLDQLAPRHITTLLNNLAEAGVRNDRRGKTLSPASITRHLRILAACLQEAVHRQLITINPARSVKAPPREVYGQQFYTEAQIKKLFDALSDEPARLRALILLALTTGMRRGEMVALEWSHIDILARSIRICQAAELIAGSPQCVKSTKTQGSIRMVIIPAITLAALQAWRKVQEGERTLLGSQWRGNNFVFTQPLGTWMLVDEVTKQFRKFLKRHDLPIIPLHGLRHTAATFLIAQGLPVRTVANVLGHTQTSTTLNIYSHVLDSSTRRAADLMDEFLDPTNPQATQQDNMPE